MLHVIKYEQPLLPHYLENIKYVWLDYRYLGTPSCDTMHGVIQIILSLQLYVFLSVGTIVQLSLRSVVIENLLLNVSWHVG